MSLGESFENLRADILCKALAATELKSLSSEGAQSLVDEYPPAISGVGQLVHQTLVRHGAYESIESLSPEKRQELIAKNPDVFLLGMYAGLTKVLALLSEYVHLEEIGRQFPDSPL